MSIYVWTSEIKNIYVWTTPVKEIFVGTEKVRPSWYIPWSNTLAYFPLENDTLDHSWNNRTLQESASWTATKQSLWYLMNGTPYVADIWATAKFISAWINVVTYWSSTVSLLWMWDWYFAYQFKENWISTMWWQWGHVKKVYSVSNWTFYRADNYYDTTSWVWYNMACWYNNSHAVFYINWEVYWDTTYIPTPPSNSAFIISNRFSSSSDNSSSMIFSDVIIEDTLRDTTKYQDYYNSTKSNYWL